jgi:hypothetical protein
MLKIKVEPKMYLTHKAKIQTDPETQQILNNLCFSATKVYNTVLYNLRKPYESWKKMRDYCEDVDYPFDVQPPKSNLNRVKLQTEYKDNHWAKNLHSQSTQYVIKEVIDSYIPKVGLYRAIFTAPGYTDSFYFFESTEDGVQIIRGVHSQYSVHKEELPVPVTLYPIESNRALRIAIAPFVLEKFTDSKTKVETINEAIHRGLLRRLAEKGLSTFVLEEGINIGFHPNVSKNLSLPPSHQFADLLIEGACRWG